MQKIKRTALSKLVEEYLMICRVEGKSEVTLRNYRYSMQRFLRFLETSGTTDSRPQILNYLASMTTLQPSSRNRFFRQTKSFYNWAVANKRLDSNPFDGIKNIRIPESIREPFSTSDIQKLVAATSGSSDREIRDRAIVMLFVDTGIRLSELAGVSYEDVDFTSRRITVKKAKGGNSRVVAYADQCAEALDSYIKIRTESIGLLFWKATSYRSLIPGSPLTAVGVRQAMIRIGIIAEVLHVYPHRFRHTFATWMIKSNAREIDVQHLLGHKSLHMIRRYTMAYRSAQAAERHSEFSPGDQMLKVQ
jgi:integrase/recombinase XerD